MNALRKILGWGIALGAAWLMAEWVYRHTNEVNCRDRGGTWNAAADSCAGAVRQRAR